MAWPKETKYLGKSTPRVEGPIKVSGRAKYSSDMAPAGMLYGAVLRSKWPAAKINAIKLDKVRAATGIKAAVTVRECPFTVRFYGEELAAIAGTSRQAVEDALQLIEVDAKPLDFVVNELDAVKPAAPRVWEENPNLGKEQVKETGKVDDAFAGAAAVVEGIYSTQVQIHQPLESFGGTVSYTDEELQAWMSSQGVFGMRDGFASALKIPQNKVRVICEHMGGGFGSKFSPGVEGLLCARLSKEAGVPVKLMITRFEASLAAGNRPSSFQKLKLGADKDGKLVAFEMENFGTTGFAAGAVNAGGSGSANLPMPYIYPVPNTRLKQASVSVNAGAARPLRAPGNPPASFGMESIMDELAVKLGMDPVELRVKNDPFEVRRKEYEIGAEKFGWKQKYQKPGSSPGPIKVGVGCAGATWPGAGRGTKAELQINPDGTVEVRCGSQDLGTGTRTVVQLVAAEMLQLDPARITALVGDTRFPPSGASGGSTQTASVTPAIYDVCEKAVVELKKVSGIEDPLGARWDEACKKIGVNPLVVQGQWREGLSSRGAGGVQFAEVEVDTETGFVKIRKILCVQDCGLVVNRLTCESQVNGGIILGIGYALYEQRIMDRATGVMLNPNLEQYKIPGAADMPEIEMILLDMPERGVIGVGEPVTIPTASAIANAVANALGVRVPSIPITPDKVLAALGKLPGAAATASSANELKGAFAAVSAAPIGPSFAENFLV